MNQVDPTAYTALQFLLMMTGAACAFALAPLLLAKLWQWFTGARPGGALKRSTYECGLESKGDAWIQIHPQFYLFAILFVVFDVEIIFLLPFAVAFPDLALGAVLVMGLFLLLLAEGLVWAWRRGFLRWR